MTTPTPTVAELIAHMRALTDAEGCRRLAELLGRWA